MRIKTPLRRVYYPDKDVSNIGNSVRNIATVSGKKNIPKADAIVRAVNVYEIREKALQAALDYLSDQAQVISEPYENVSAELALLLVQLETALQEGR